MSRNLYIATTEAHSGKSAIVLGVMETLVKNIAHVGFFRPIVNIDRNDPEARDNDTELVISHFNLDIPYEDTYALTLHEATELLDQGQEGEILNAIMNKYSAIADKYDFILCEGTDYKGVTSAMELDINAEVATNLNCPVLLVTNGKRDNEEDIMSSVQIAWTHLKEKGCEILATVINRAHSCDFDRVRQRLRERLNRASERIYLIPEDPRLARTTIEEVVEHLDAEVLYGEDLLTREVVEPRVAAAHLSHLLGAIKDGDLIITPGDRDDVLLGTLLSHNSLTSPNITGIVLTMGIRPAPHIDQLLRGLTMVVPVLSVQQSTYVTAMNIHDMHPKLRPGSTAKINTALNIFDKYMGQDASNWFESLKATKPTVITPRMFEFQLLQKAKQDKQRIVLPEGSEERILLASQQLLRRDAVDIVLLGDEKEIRTQMTRLGLKLSRAEIVNPVDHPKFEEYVDTFYDMRKHKGITRENAHDTMVDLTYFGTMMVYKGDADGMVSGAIHTTRNTIRPALQFVKTKPGVSVVSSVFFMCLADRVLVYGDCAVNPNPTAEELAEIAICSAQTAQAFGIDPIVAMCSYSSGSSGQGADVEKVRKATQLAQERAPELLIDGPLQYDAATDPGVGQQKMPGSKVAGHATVFIFPDLNTGNTTYKAVQRTAGAVSIGPVLQGLNKPVNDLSRGCTVPDILNTVAITAIQAQAEKKAANAAPATA